MTAEWRKKIFIRHLFLLFFASTVFVSARGQMMDSIYTAFGKKPKLTGGFSTKTSFIDGFNSPVFSVQGGLDFNRVVRTGFSWNWIKLSPYKPGRNNTPFYLDKILVDSLGKPDTLHPALQLSYLSYFFEYIFFRSRFWQFSIPLQAGAGASRYQYMYQGSKTKEDRHFILLYEPAVSGKYKITKWLGIGVDIGYRFMIINNKKIGSKFNSPVYDFKVLLFIGSLYKAVFPKSKLAQKASE